VNEWESESESIERLSAAKFIDGLVSVNKNRTL
jgi:hypothetical protein